MSKYINGYGTINEELLNENKERGNDLSSVSITQIRVNLEDGKNITAYVSGFSDVFGLRGIMDLDGEIFVPMHSVKIIANTGKTTIGELLGTQEKATE